MKIFLGLLFIILFVLILGNVEVVNGGGAQNELCPRDNRLYTQSDCNSGLICTPFRPPNPTDAYCGLPSPDCPYQCHLGDSSSTPPIPRKCEGKNPVECEWSGHGLCWSWAIKEECLESCSNGECVANPATSCPAEKNNCKLSEKQLKDAADEIKKKRLEQIKDDMDKLREKINVTKLKTNPTKEDIKNYLDYMGLWFKSLQYGAPKTIGPYLDGVGPGDLLPAIVKSYEGKLGKGKSWPQNDEANYLNSLALSAAYYQHLAENNQLTTNEDTRNDYIKSVNDYYDKLLKYQTDKGKQIINPADIWKARSNLELLKFNNRDTYANKLQQLQDNYKLGGIGKDEYKKQMPILLDKQNNYNQALNKYLQDAKKAADASPTYKPNLIGTKSKILDSMINGLDNSVKQGQELYNQRFPDGGPGFEMTSFDDMMKSAGDWAHYLLVTNPTMRNAVGGWLSMTPEQAAADKNAKDALIKKMKSGLVGLKAALNQGVDVDEFYKMNPEQQIPLIQNSGGLSFDEAHMLVNDAKFVRDRLSDVKLLENNGNTAGISDMDLNPQREDSLGRIPVNQFKFIGEKEIVYDGNTPILQPIEYGAFAQNPYQFETGPENRFNEMDLRSPLTEFFMPLVMATGSFGLVARAEALLAAGQSAEAGFAAANFMGTIAGWQGASSVLENYDPSGSLGDLAGIAAFAPGIVKAGAGMFFGKGAKAGLNLRFNDEASLNKFLDGLKQEGRKVIPVTKTKPTEPVTEYYVDGKKVNTEISKTPNPEEKILGDLLKSVEQCKAPPTNPSGGKIPEPNPERLPILDKNELNDWVNSVKDPYQRSVRKALADEFMKDSNHVSSKQFNAELKTAVDSFNKYIGDKKYFAVGLDEGSSNAWVYDKMYNSLKQKPESYQFLDAVNGRTYEGVNNGINNNFKKSNVVLVGDDGIGTGAQAKMEIVDRLSGQYIASVGKDNALKNPLEIIFVVARTTNDGAAFLSSNLPPGIKVKVFSGAKSPTVGETLTKAGLPTIPTGENYKKGQVLNFFDSKVPDQVTLPLDLANFVKDPLTGRPWNDVAKDTPEIVSYRDPAYIQRQICDMNEKPGENPPISPRFETPPIDPYFGEPCNHGYSDAFGGGRGNRYMIQPIGGPLRPNMCFTRTINPSLVKSAGIKIGDTLKKLDPTNTKQLTIPIGAGGRNFKIIPSQMAEWIRKHGPAGTETRFNNPEEIIGQYLYKLSQYNGDLKEVSVNAIAQNGKSYRISWGLPDRLYRDASVPSAQKTWILDLRHASIK